MGMFIVICVSVGVGFVIGLLVGRDLEKEEVT